MTEEEIEALAAEITRRVQARLPGGARPQGQGPSASSLPLRSLPCEEAPGDHCNDCGGLCVVRRPWAARAVADAGALRIGAPAGVGEVEAELAAMIDHTLLKQDATKADIRKVCEEARRYRFASVCVNSTWVPVVKAYLEGSPVLVCAVVGFPLGAMAPTAKAFEAKEAVRAGADEIDMVINVGALKSRDYELVLEDIARVVQAASPARVKVILETGGLTTEEKVIGITLSKVGGAHFVKTSTGVGPGGATVDDVALMRRLVGHEMGVKASGGIRTRDDAEKMKQAGADRLGASASVAIVTPQPPQKGRGAGAGRRPLPVTGASGAGGGAGKRPASAY
jgi:deoxyribose-phosphate aldolase